MKKHNSDFTLKDRKKFIDCLIIGPNELPINEFEDVIAAFGENSATYRNYNLNFIRYRKRSYSCGEFVELLDEDLKVQSGNGKKKLLTGLAGQFSLTVVYLTSFLKRRGFSVEFINSFRNNQDKLISILNNRSIRIIAISTTLYVNPIPIQQIVSFVRKYNQNAEIVIGGPFVFSQYRLQPVKSLRHFFQLLKADFYRVSLL